MLKVLTDKKSSSSMMFAIDSGCTITDIRKRNGDKCKMAKGWKIPISKIKPRSLAIINGTSILTEVKMIKLRQLAPLLQ